MTVYDRIKMGIETVWEAVHNPNYAESLYSAVNQAVGTRVGKVASSGAVRSAIARETSDDTQ